MVKQILENNQLTLCPSRDDNSKKVGLVVTKDEIQNHGRSNSKGKTVRQTVMVIKQVDGTGKQIT